MATGIPRTRVRKGAPDALPVSLDYPGKRPADTILATAPGTFKLAQGHDGQNRKRLYFGENLAALAALAQAPGVCGKVRLAYVDGPFATQTVFQSRKLAHAYEDVFECAEYLEFMRERLIFLHRVMAEDGSIYVHLDAKNGLPHQSHYG